ncbi:MAG: SDR family NAD(P)-dependent oxidoreductase, partial [Acidobacteriota bacterium]|nr:SDR family NAD(P)-dependent oxidoreductase [Acidobacteriota bacterium]
MHASDPVLSTQFAHYPCLKGRAVLVTGGASGIGASLVEHFAQQGCRVAFFDIQDDAAKSLVERLTGAGSDEVHYLHCDIAKVDELQKAVVTATQKLGRLDVLVNNAGNDQRHNLDTLTVEDWDKSMAINLRPQFFTIQAALPALRTSAKAG